MLLSGCVVDEVGNIHGDASQGTQEESADCASCPQYDLELNELIAVLVQLSVDVILRVIDELLQLNSIKRLSVKGMRQEMMMRWVGVDNERDQAGTCICS